MKRTLLATAFTLILSSPAIAYDVHAQVVDHFSNVTRNVPNYERVCHTVQVPIYGEVKTFNNGTAILGGLVGGLIGNQFGGGSGRDAMTAAGAIAGTITGGSQTQQQVQGYRQVEECTNRQVYTQVVDRVYTHSTIQWQENGRDVIIRFEK